MFYECERLVLDATFPIDKRTPRAPYIAFDIQKTENRVTMKNAKIVCMTRILESDRFFLGLKTY